MYLTKEVKESIFEKHGKSKTNTGSSEGQIALFTHRINHLTGHLKQNRKDFNTERSLVKLVGKRRSLLDYLKKTDIARYRAIIIELENNTYTKRGGFMLPLFILKSNYYLHCNNRQQHNNKQTN